MTGNGLTKTEARQSRVCEACGQPWDEHGGMNATCPTVRPAHTLGPWEWNETGGYIVAPNFHGVIVAKVAFRAPESVANAHLIAAAPELYAALKAVISVADRKTVEFDMAHAAIAKADGCAPDSLSGFPIVVTCECGAKTGFTEAGEHYFECRDCGRLNQGEHGQKERSE